jgi:forespore regulator of the sigma-K checkpoint
VIRLYKLTAVMMLILLTLFTFTFHPSNAQEGEKNDGFESSNDNNEEVKGEDNNHFVSVDPLKLKVVLRRLYLEGEISEEIRTETIWSMEDFWAKYENWQLVDQQEGSITFQKKVEDISPLLKVNGHFGIDKNGILTLYKGNPSEQEAIQSFFQINIKKLESNLRQELEEGIVILNKDRFHEVIQVMKRYEIQ